MAQRSQSLTPGADGECGYQHGMAPCLPMQGRTCCSINGYCGYNETYCFTSNGCQYGCVDPADFYPTSHLTATTTISVKQTSGVVSNLSIPTSKSQTTNATPHSATSSQTNAATALPNENSGHSGSTRTKVIIGASVGGVVFLILIICAVVYICWRKRRTYETNSRPDSTTPTPMVQPVQDPVGYHTGVNAMPDFRIDETGDRRR